MQKLMICAIKCGQSTPNVLAVFLPISTKSLPMLPNKTNDS